MIIACTSSPSSVLRCSRQLNARTYTHAEIHPAMIFGVCAWKLRVLRNSERRWRNVKQGHRGLQMTPGIRIQSGSYEDLRRDRQTVSRACFTICTSEIFRITFLIVGKAYSDSGFFWNQALPICSTLSRLQTQCLSNEAILGQWIVKEMCIRKTRLWDLSRHHAEICRVICPGEHCQRKTMKLLLSLDHLSQASIIPFPDHNMSPRRCWDMTWPRAFHVLSAFDAPTLELLW